MRVTLAQRAAALAIAVTATFTVVWAHANHAYPALSAPALIAQAQSCRS